MKYFSVTEVLSKYSDFSSIPDQILYQACQRGNEVHRVCEAYAQVGFVSASSINELHIGYFNSFKRWYDRNAKACLICEQTYTDSVLGFTGRPDLVLALRSGLTALIDIKTPVTDSPSWKVQLAAYRYLLQESGVKIDTCIALQPRINGSMAKVHRWDEWGDYFAVFLAALNAHRNLT